MKNLIITILVLLFSSSTLFAQNVSINADGSLADTSAMLDVSSTSKGFLLPRMTTSQQNSIILPANGLSIFNTDLNSIMINTGTPLSPVWSALAAGSIDTSSIANFSAKVRSLFSSTAPITYSNGLIGITQATTSTDGYLSSTDWNTFNNKQPAGSYLTANQTITLSGDVTGSGTTAITTNVGKINGTSLASLGTGILKNTTGTGIPSIAIASDFPTLNQNTTGSAAKFTTARTISITGDLAYTSPAFNGTANVTAAGTLATVNANVGSFTNANITVNAKGLITAASNGNSGTVTSIATGYGLSGGTITSTGTIIVDSATLHLKFLALKDSVNSITGYTTLYQNSLKQNQLNGTGFIKATGTTISYDNSTYLTSIDTSNISNFSIKVRSLFSSTAPITYSNGLIGITQAGTSTDGYLSSTDWNTFNNKQPAGSYLTANQTITLSGDVTGSGTTAITTNVGKINGTSLASLGTGILKNTTGTGVPSIAIASDFPTLNQNTTGSAATLTTGRTIGITGDLTYTSPAFNGSSNVTAAGTLATVNANVGSFTNANITVNGKGLITAASNGTAGTVTNIATGYGLSGGPITSTGTIIVDSATLHLKFLALKDSVNSITGYTTLYQNSLKQNQLNGTGFVKATGTTISYDNSTYLTGNQTISFAPTGDVTGSTTGTTTLAPALVIGTNKVLNGMLAQMPTLTIKGNNTGATANAQDLTVAQVNAILPVFTATLNGLVPFSGGSAGKVLHGDGIWRDTASASNSWSIIGNSGTSYLTNFLGTTDNNSLRFRTNNAQGMILDSLQNVAIAASPSFSASNPEKLLVDAGSTSFNVISGKGNLNNYLQLNIKNSNSGASASSDVVATNDAGNETTNYVDLGINSSGYSSTGVLGGANNAYLYSNANDFIIGNNSAGMPVRFFTTNSSTSTEAVRIDSSGRVGIGTTTPAYKLQVSGTNPVSLLGVQLGTNTSGDSVLTITGGLVRKLPASTFATSAAAISSLNGLTATTQTFATGNAGSDFNILSSGSVHTFNIPDASASNRGVMTTGTQTIAGNKSLSGNTNVGGTFGVKGNSTFTGTITASTLNSGSSTDSVVTANGSGVLNKRTVSDLLSGNAITSMNGLTGSVQTFAVGTSGTNFNISSAGTTHTFNIPDASASNRGVMTTGTQTIAGNKTLSGNTSIGGTLGVTGAITASTLASGSSTDSIVTANAGGVLRRRKLSDVLGTSSGWSTTGNSGTSSSTNFIGTIDKNNFLLKTNSSQAMIVDTNQNVAIGSSPTFSLTNAEQLLVVDAATGNTNYQNVIVGKGNTNSYSQLNIQNYNAGTNASSDVVATSDNGNESANYIDMGMNSSANTSTGVIGGVNTAYLYSTGNDFAIGNSTASKNLIFFTGGTGSNERMRIDGNGNVGIGTSSPGQKLDVTGSINASTDIISQGNVWVDRAGANTGSSSPGLRFGDSNTGETIASNRNSGSNQYGLDFYTAYNNRMSITNSGNVGIGTSAPGYKFTVAGIVAPSADNTYSLGGGTGNRWTAVYATNGTIQTSDRRLKTNIKPLTYGLKEIMAMQPVSYNWKTTPDSNKKIGLIAQDVKQIVPEVVTGDEAKEKLGMNYGELVPVLINAIKEQQKQIDDLKKEVELLKNK